MSCVRAPEMARLVEGTSDDAGCALCCGGFLCPRFTSEEAAESLRALEEQATLSYRGTEPRVERRPTFLEALAESIRASLSLRRKSHIEPKKLTCCLLEPWPKVKPCPVCPILLCPVCDTLHCHPNYIYHCLLEHPIRPMLERCSQAPGHELDVHRSRSPLIHTPSDLHVAESTTPPP